MPALKTAAPAKKYYKMKDNVTGYLLLAPWLFGFFFMWLIPAAMSIYYSLTDYNLLSAPNFVGLKNYITIFTNDKNFKQAMIVTFSDVYNKLLDNYKAFSTAGSVYSDFKQRKKAEDKFKYELKRRLDLRNRIYKVQTDAFGNGNKIAEHYLNNDMNLPIWAIYELLSLGEFGHFVSCLNFPCRQAISSKLGIRASDDSNALLPQRLIYVIKDLRNAIAHNDVVFDTRFRTNKIDRQVCNAISNATNVPNLNFETITDYLVLIVYLLSLLRISKNDSKRLISSYIECTERLRKAIPANVYSQIIRTDNSSKVVALRKFI